MVFLVVLQWLLTMKTLGKKKQHEKTRHDRENKTREKTKHNMIKLSRNIDNSRFVLCFYNGVHDQEVHEKKHQEKP